MPTGRGLPAPGAELVEAAYIVPTRDERGKPEVPNGLCRLHHGLDDRNLLGIWPDLVVEIASRLMEERDGPVLEHAIKGFHGKIQVPAKRAEHHIPEFLEERFALFRAA